MAWYPEGRFKTAYELLNLSTLKYSTVNILHIFQWMSKVFCVEFQRVPLKFLTKYLTHTLKDTLFIQRWHKNSPNKLPFVSKALFNQFVWIYTTKWSKVFLLHIIMAHNICVNSFCKAVEGQIILATCHAHVILCQRFKNYMNDEFINIAMKSLLILQLRLMRVTTSHITCKSIVCSRVCIGYQHRKQQIYTLIIHCEVYTPVTNRIIQNALACYDVIVERLEIDAAGVSLRSAFK